MVDGDRSADPPISQGIVLASVIENFAGGFAGGDALVVGRKRRQFGIPLRRQIAGEHGFDLARGVGKFLPVAGESLGPFLAQCAPALADAVLETLIDAVRHQKLGVFRPAVSVLGETHFFLAERVAMRGRRVLFVRRAVADDAVDDDECRDDRRFA